MGRHPSWSKPEHDFLEELIGNYPFREVVKRYQSKAKKEGWPVRSRHAIEVRVSRHIGSRKAIDRNFTYHALARILGYNRHRVREWYRGGKLKAKKIGYITKITEAHLNEFVRQYPHYLSDADWMGLVFLFGESKAQQIKEYESTVTKPQKVRCKKTGIIYPSLKTAALANHMDKSTVRRRAMKGQDFEFLEAS